MKMKGWIMALVLCMVISLTGTLKVWAAVSSADFTDLKDLDAATKAKFDAMISAGIFDGASDSEFGLNDNMNRGQFAKVAALIYGLDTTKAPATPSFTDVPSNHYALPYIEAIKAAGITDGVGEGRFDPAGDVTKEQLAAFLVKGLGKPVDDQKPVDDTTVSDWAKGYVAAALQLKLLSNGADGMFGGTANASRDLLLLASYEAAKQADKINLPPLPSPPPVETPPVEPGDTGGNPVENPGGNPVENPEQPYSQNGSS